MSHYDDTPWMVAGVPCPGRAYSWEEVWKYADFPVADVQKVIACRDGENDERNWVLIALLKDGRTGIVIAGCDYSGWG